MTLRGLYILRDGEPVETDDFVAWGDWWATAERHVGKTTVGDLEVSTVFLGIDHAFMGGPPLLYETMIFGTDEEYCERYSTRAEAEAGHAEAVRIAELKRRRRAGGASE